METIIERKFVYSTWIANSMGSWVNFDNCYCILEIDEKGLRRLKKATGRICNYSDTEKYPTLHEYYKWREVSEEEYLKGIEHECWEEVRKIISDNIGAKDLVTLLKLKFKIMPADFDKSTTIRNLL